VGQRDRARLGELSAELGALVCAEDVSGQKAAEADLPPSPAALESLDLAGRRGILAPTNGTLAAERVRGGGRWDVLVGAIAKRPRGDAVGGRPGAAPGPQHQPSVRRARAVPDPRPRRRLLRRGAPAPG